MINQLTFVRELRLLTPKDFNHVFNDSIRASSPYITFISRRNNLNHPRVGFAIAKKQVKRAHERNRLKRIIREYFRLMQHDLPDMDVVVMARTAAIDIDNAELKKIIDKLWQRTIWVENNKNKEKS